MSFESYHRLNLERLAGLSNHEDKKVRKWACEVNERINTLPKWYFKTRLASEPSTEELEEFKQITGVNFEDFDFSKYPFSSP